MESGCELQWKYSKRLSGRHLMELKIVIFAKDSTGRTRISDEFVETCDPQRDSESRKIEKIPSISLSGSSVRIAPWPPAEIPKTTIVSDTNNHGRIMMSETFGLGQSDDPHSADCSNEGSGTLVPSVSARTIAKLMKYPPDSC